MKRKFIVALLWLGSLLTTHAVAATFQLETSTIILNESDGEAVFNIKNTGSEPLLLLSTVEDLKGDAIADRLLMTPPVTRIDPDDTQVIRIQLKSGAELDVEHMARAGFEGVTVAGGSQMRMPVRQEIALIVQPKRVPVIAKPWENLRWSVRDGHLLLRNDGKQMVRMVPQVTVLPSGESLRLGQAYLRPGETIRRPLPAASKIEKLSLTPLSRFAYALEEATIPSDPS